MKHDIIKTDDYLLVVDENEIAKGNWHLKNDVMITRGHLIDENCKKIIAHLPLNGSSILKGVDLLPPLPQHHEEDVEKLAKDWVGNQTKNEFGKPHNAPHRVKLFADGYNKAKEKYKYTDEDLYMLAAFVTDFIAGRKGDFITTTPKNVADKFIQSLSQANMPIGFEFEASKSKPIFNGEPKTLSNVVGFTRWTWEGKYIYQ